MTDVQAYERMNVADALQTKYYEDEAIINQVATCIVLQSIQRYHIAGTREVL